jgi:glycosyltransferase involved in cell wall biosynthesis
MNQTKNDSVDIVLATYNGAKFLTEQINSILNQTYPNWHLLIGDDGSTDSTPEILQAFKGIYPDKITICPFKDNVGVSQNFSRLLELTDAPYMMLCDQDDFWLPEKIELTLFKMKELEETWGSEEPLLVHTDMEVVDDNLNLIAASQWKRQHLNPKDSVKLNAVLMQNASWGCTMMFNRALIDIALPIPTESFIHDYWLVLVAAACGHIDYVNKPTMLYRQHEKNWIGSKAANFSWFIENIKAGSEHQEKIEMRMMKNMVRGYILYKRYHNVLSEEQRNLLVHFINLKYQPLWKELYWRMRYGFTNHGFWPNVDLLLTTIRMGRADPKSQPKF